MQNSILMKDTQLLLTEGRLELAIPFYLAFGISPSDDCTTEAQPHPVEKPQKKQVQPSYLPHQTKRRQRNRNHTHNWYLA